MTLRRVWTSALLAVLVFIGDIDSAVAGSAPGRAQYSVVRVPIGSPDAVRRIASLGIALDGSRVRDGSGVEMTLNQREIRKLRDAGFAVEILVPDWRSGYAARLEADAVAASPASRARHFRLGSMGGFLTLAEVEVVVDSMILLYPHLIRGRDSIGRSWEGRTLWSVRISGVSASGEKPRVLYTAMHHSREPGGMMTLIYYMWYLLEQYGSNPEITALLDTRELWFVPVLNPDGYVYNEQESPSGGGLWRKNRRPNADSSFGIDLNRNYAFKWGFDNYGSTADPEDETYRGSAPFSEPETQAVRDLCRTLKPVCALNYHTYGNVLVHPYGYIDNPTADSLKFRGLADVLIADNNFLAGTCYTTVGYPTNGDSDDWMYADTSGRPAVFALTPEVGNIDDGFWPLPSRIVPLVDASLGANIRFAQCAGKHLAVVSLPRDPVVSGETLEIDFTLANVGLRADNSEATLRFESNEVEVVSSSRTTAALNDSTEVTLGLRPRPGVQDGTRAVVRIVCDFAGGHSEDSISFRLGVPTVLFSDTAQSASPYWIASSTGSLTTWAYTTRSAYSGGGSYADSPWGPYPSGYASTFTLRDTLPLMGAAAELRFVARWDIEHEYDFCLVEVSPDSGATWISLPGRYTRPGSGVTGGKQLDGTWGYDRKNDSWVRECIDLARVVGTHAMVRFRFASDNYVECDGFFVDDLEIRLYAPGSASHVQEQEVPGRMQLEQNWPNPFNPATTIRFTVAGVAALSGAFFSGVEGPAASGQRTADSRVKLAVYDLLGREVAVLVDGQQEPGEYTATWDATGMSSGVYFYRLTVGEFREARTMLLLR